MQKKYLISLLPCFVFSAVLTADTARSGSLFRSYELHCKGRILSYHIEDLDNDGLQDIAVFTTPGSDTSSARRLVIFMQTPDGFPQQPTQSLEIGTDLILFDFGDVSADAKKEMVFFRTTGVYYFEHTAHGFARTPYLLFETPSILLLTDPTSPRRWDFVTDRNGDGVDELIVPQIDRLHIFFRKSNGDGWRDDTVVIPAEARVFSYFDPRFSVGHKTEVLYSTPYLLQLDFTSDGKNDLVAVYRDSLLIFDQRADGFFARNFSEKIPLHFGEIWRGAKIQRTHLDDKSEKQYLMRILDLDHDGLPDIVSVKSSTRESLINPKSVLQIYRGKRTAGVSPPRVYYESTPDQVVVPDGSMLVLDFLDVNHDQKVDLAITSVKIGLSNIIKILLTKTVEFDAGFYLMQTDGRFADKPDAVCKLPVRFSFKGGAASPVYEIADFNGDQQSDVLGSMDEQRLVVFWGDPKKIINAAVGVTYAAPVPQDGTLVRAVDLNGDGKSDLIIQYDPDDLTDKRIQHPLRIFLAN